jgi:CHAT domain-containing protein
VLAVPDERAPSIAAEAEAVAATTPSSRLLAGSAATFEALRSSLPGPAYLHLACHGLYRSSNPMFSALRLTDRWVTASEILELDLGGAVVALSACESGRAGSETAEPVGLAWAFLVAGASAVLVSQWIVDDDSTAGVMTEFYTQLAAGAAPALALRRAQLAAAGSLPHPFQWAPFVHVTSPSSNVDRTLL